MDACDPHKRGIWWAKQNGTVTLEDSELCRNGVICPGSRNMWLQEEHSVVGATLSGLGTHTRVWILTHHLFSP